MHDDAPLYELAASELVRGMPDRGILAKSFCAALGDERKARALYIEFRVEQLKEGIVQLSVQKARAAAKQAAICTGGRKAYLADLSDRFGHLRKMVIPESETPSSAYAGDPNGIADAVRLSNVSEAIGMLEFKLVDAAKAGLIGGVIDREGEWWIAPRRAEGMMV